MKDGGLSYVCFCCTFLLRGWTLLNARSAIRRLIHCENVESEGEGAQMGRWRKGGTFLSSVSSISCALWSVS